MKKEDPINPLVTSGRNLSYWIDSVEPIKFQALMHPCTTDIAVVGAGISGLSVAYNLLKAGKKVKAFEDGYVGSGETGEQRRI
ncbi:FAD-dependent oxidoreductase [Daejeonella sp.]|uniref:FAD-dependent oxidoreductase n=1 Tax=Daejeonella sp. TaxID=2805397 RepID=UPI003983B6E8